jgi:hypothetical protein
MLLAAGVVTGCDPEPPPPADTGAKETVQQYGDALRGQDWRRAYGLLHPESQARHSAEEFARLAARYRRGFGFEPEPVRIRSCQELGTKAVAHIVWTGQKAGRRQSYKDALVLKSSQSGWAVVLPRNFGSERLR